ncbi:MAG: response regulator [Nitrospinae bacterium]|nr:response regulator [Nitrospinota bacterium]
MEFDKNTKKMKILITDDFTNMRRTIKNMLRQIGFENIDEADDGDTALAKLQSGLFGFLILDWNMPRMPGIQVVRAVRADNALRHLPILMVTAENWEDEIVEAAEEQVNGYIIKPFVTKILEDKIAEILEKVKNPPEGEVIFDKGIDFLDKKMYDEAKIEFEKALKIKPNSAKATYFLGLAYFEKGELDKAEELFKAAISYNQRYVKAHHSLGELMYKKGDIKSAIGHLEQASSISPRAPQRQILLGELYIKEKRYNDALTLFKRAMEQLFSTAEIKEKIKEMVKGLPDDEKPKFKDGLRLEL